MSGSLHVVGTGFKVASQITPEALACFRQAERVFAAPGDPATRLYLQRLRPDVVSLEDFYGEGKRRDLTYEEMAETLLTEVRAGHSVCAAFYGHPGVFVNPSHAAIKQARSEGFEARMYPGISAESCLFADLAVDPADRGCHSLEATDFLTRRESIDPSTALILWQIGAVGVAEYYKAAMWSQSGLEQLTSRLLDFYPREHTVYVYEASPLPICDPRIEPVALIDLPHARVSIISTLFVPSSTVATFDESMFVRARSVLGDRCCKKAPGDAPYRPLPTAAAQTAPGSLTLAGLGYRLAGQVTPEVNHRLVSADRLLYLVTDPLMSAWLQGLNSNSESLHPLYREGSGGDEAGAAIAARICAAVESGENVCAAFTGHPSVLLPPALDALRMVREAGFAATVLPGVSVDDCLVADLGFDPGVQGRQIFDATDFLLRPRAPDTRSHLLILQAGVVAELVYRSEQSANPEMLQLLLERLLEHYPGTHDIFIYEQSQNPLVADRMERTSLDRLPSAGLSVTSTLFVPALAAPAVKAETQKSVAAG